MGGSPAKQHLLSKPRDLFDDPQVNPPSSLDPCLSPPDAVAERLKSYVLGEGNPLDGFLNKGELSQAAQLSLSVLKSVNEKNDCGQELDPSVKQLVRSQL